MTMEIKQQISVIGLGVAEDAMLNETAIQALQSADLVIGSERQLLTIKTHLSDTKTAQLPK